VSPTARSTSRSETSRRPWGVLERLGVVDIVDEVVGSRRSDAALSVGTYIALAALNRVVAPCSKLAFF